MDATILFLLSCTCQFLKMYMTRDKYFEIWLDVT